MKQAITLIDVFSGSGQFTDGVLEACKELGIRVKRVVAINHNADACATYKANHPEAEVIHSRVDQVHPWALFPKRRADMLIGGPECIYFTKARGALPVDEQSRASIWDIIRMADAIDVEKLLLENVLEFVEFGPLVWRRWYNRKTKKHELRQFPDPERKGELFKQVVETLKVMGYHLEYRGLCSADYGDPTTRKRLYILARKDRRVRWPEPTHSQAPHPTLFSQPKPWVPARSIIDFSIPNPSIFLRKKRLVPNTIGRIVSGLERFSGLSLKVTRTGVLVLDDGQFEPFLLNNRGGNDGYLRGVGTGSPVPSITTSNPMGLVEHSAIMLPLEGIYRGNAPRGIDDTFSTVVASRGGGHLVESLVLEPNLIVQRGTKPAQIAQTALSLNGPVPTIATDDHIGLSQPVIVGYEHNGRSYGGNSPMPSLTGSGDYGLAHYILQYHGGRRAAERVYSVNEPVPTVDGSNRYSLISPGLATVNAEDCVDIDPNGDPWAVLTHQLNHFDSYIARSGDVVGLKLLLLTGQVVLLDIRYRMFEIEELARAQGFRAGYTFIGTRKSIKKQIGNAVTRKMVTALATAHLS